MRPEDPVINTKGMGERVGKVGKWEGGRVGEVLVYSMLLRVEALFR
jgi:hypothetical protein